jgi:hypothetical protein
MERGNVSDILEKLVWRDIFYSNVRCNMSLYYAVGTTAGGREAFCKYGNGYKDEGSLFTPPHVDRACEQ